MNCWEFMNCGREAGGTKIAEFGICPSYPDKGTTRARIKGTLCNGKVQGTFATKLGSRKDCAFYNSTHYDRDYIMDRLPEVRDH